MNIAELVKNAGVVGAGGAGFPTHIKLQAKVDTVIVNGAECEPLLRCDQQIMDFYAERVVRGLQLAVESTGAKNGIIALKEKYHKAIESLNRTIAQLHNRTISLHLLDNFYPAGDEFVLVYEVTGKIIPESGLPLNVGIVVNNAVTLMNIANAVDEKPVTDRPLTVCGAVKNPFTAFFPIGTSVSEIINFAGGPNLAEYVILDGGPMMGIIIPEKSSITKKTSGILVLPSDSEVVYQKTNRHAVKQIKSACEQCQDCTEICPRFLLGHELECHKIQRSTSVGLQDNITQAFMCCECGLCDWICPVKLLPRRVNQESKKLLFKQGVENPHHKTPTAVHPMMDYRRVPIERVLGRLDLIKYDKPAPFTDKKFDISKVAIPLHQNVGVPAESIVKMGDVVKKGQLIAKIPDGKLSANIHASIDGKITEINSSIKIER
ncbi:MAG: SLBB domain-containing protein [Elusimicrobia bacterium]|nr:SLBB domain-containing protein [Elusimicrobiota bacterium]